MFLQYFSLNSVEKINMRQDMVGWIIANPKGMVYETSTPDECRNATDSQRQIRMQSKMLPVILENSVWTVLVIMKCQTHLTARRHNQV